MGVMAEHRVCTEKTISQLPVCYPLPKHDLCRWRRSEQEMGDEEKWHPRQNQGVQIGLEFSA